MLHTLPFFLSSSIIRRSKRHSMAGQSAFWSGSLAPLSITKALADVWMDSIAVAKVLHCDWPPCLLLRLNSNRSTILIILIN